jgi:hypothetical protein
MTDTRTTQTTDMPADVERVQDEALQRGEPPATQLSTADIAGQPAAEQARGTGDATGTATGSAAAATAATPRATTPGRAHESNMPEASVAPLFAEDALNELRDRWTDVQAGFVDEPRSSVEQADSLVAEVMKRLADSFATERQALEQQWSRGDDASTEDLRVALRRYRSFFDRLLSI